MGVVVYQCDTCRREVDIVRNERGLDTVKRCVITNGCKGSLFQVAERNTSVYGRPLEDVEGLDNYRQRNVLYIHEQLLSSTNWIINHNLNTNPTVVVYIDFVEPSGRRTYRMLDPDDYVVTFSDGDNISIEFATGTTGLAHIIARSSNPRKVDIQSVVRSWYQVTANSILTVGIKYDKDPALMDADTVTDRTLYFISPSTSEVISTNVPFTSHKSKGEIALFNTPWQDANVIFVNGSLYKVKSARVNDILNSLNIEDGSPFYFDDPTNMIILTSVPPYSSLNVDASLKKAFDPSTLGTTSLSANSRVTDSQLTIDETQSMEYHPPIKIIERIF